MKSILVFNSAKYAIPLVLLSVTTCRLTEFSGVDSFQGGSEPAVDSSDPLQAAGVTGYRVIAKPFWDQLEPSPNTCKTSSKTTEYLGNLSVDLALNAGCDYKVRVFYGILNSERQLEEILFSSEVRDDEEGEVITKKQIEKGEILNLRIIELFANKGLRSRRLQSGLEVHARVVSFSATNPNSPFSVDSEPVDQATCKSNAEKVFYRFVAPALIACAECHSNREPVIITGADEENYRTLLNYRKYRKQLSVYPFNRPHPKVSDPGNRLQNALVRWRSAEAFCGN